jgi:hypothetical protein
MITKNTKSQYDLVFILKRLPNYKKNKSRKEDEKKPKKYRKK